VKPEDSSPGTVTPAAESAIRASLETSRHRDLAEIQRRLTDWLAARWSGASVSRIAVPETSGASSELFFVTLVGTPFKGGAVTEGVLRLSPAYPVYPFVDLGLQLRCMQAAATRSPAPVPQAYAHEADAAAIGAPFLLMERKSGRGAPDWPSYVREGWIKELEPREQRQLWLNGAAAVAAVHATDLSGGILAGAELPTPGSTLLDQSLAYWRRYLELVAPRAHNPILEQAVAWLERERPRDFAVPPVLVWGDASLRNMLFDGLTPSGLMDFEFAHVGLYPFDIAFYALMDYVMAEGFGEGTPRLPGFLGVMATLDYYQELTGRPVPARKYFLRMAVTYMSLATTRVFQRLAAEGRLPESAIVRNPPVRILTEIFENDRLPA
jgi:aminoglycoside phosphotransferase (APT) family kinase protein